MRLCRINIFVVFDGGKCVFVDDVDVLLQVIGCGRRGEGSDDD